MLCRKGGLNRADIGAIRIFPTDTKVEIASSAAGSFLKNMDFGAISIFLQAAYDIALGHRVSASCFHPRPDVDSVLLNLVKKTNPFVFAAEDKALIRGCFQQRRKQIGAVIRDRIPGREREWRELLSSEGLSPTIRAEAIPVPVWIRLVSGPRRPA